MRLERALIIRNWIVSERIRWSISQHKYLYRAHQVRLQWVDSSCKFSAYKKRIRHASFDVHSLRARYINSHVLTLSPNQERERKWLCLGLVKVVSPKAYSAKWRPAMFGCKRERLSNTTMTPATEWWLALNFAWAFLRMSKRMLVCASFHKVSSQSCCIVALALRDDRTAE